MNPHQARRERGQVYAAALDRLHQLTAMASPGPARGRRVLADRRVLDDRRRLGAELRALGPNLARLGSPGIAAALATIAEDLESARMHDPGSVIDLARRMADEVDSHLGMPETQRDQQHPAARPSRDL